MSTARASSVVIMGKKYQLSVPEGRTEDLLRAAETVDQAMCRIRDAGKTKAISQIAVLAALNIAYENLSPTDEAAAQENPHTTDAETAQDAADHAGREQLQLRMNDLMQRLDDLLAEDGRLL